MNGNISTTVSDCVYLESHLLFKIGIYWLQRYILIILWKLFNMKIMKSKKIQIYKKTTCVCLCLYLWFCYLIVILLRLRLEAPCCCNSLFHSLFKLTCILKTNSHFFWDFPILNMEGISNFVIVFLHCYRPTRCSRYTRCLSGYPITHLICHHFEHYSYSVH